MESGAAGGVSGSYFAELQSVSSLPCYVKGCCVMACPTLPYPFVPRSNLWSISRAALHCGLPRSVPFAFYQVPSIPRPRGHRLLHQPPFRRTTGAHQQYRRCHCRAHSRQSHPFLFRPALGCLDLPSARTLMAQMSNLKTSPHDQVSVRREGGRMCKWVCAGGQVGSSRGYTKLVLYNIQLVMAGHDYLEKYGGVTTFP